MKTGYERSVLRGLAMAFWGVSYVRYTSHDSTSTMFEIDRHSITTFADIVSHDYSAQCVSPMIVLVTIQFGTIILAEAGLSYIGIGIKPPGAAWGAMVNDGYRYLLTNPLLSFAPGLAGHNAGGVCLQSGRRRFA